MTRTKLAAIAFGIALTLTPRMIEAQNSTGSNPPTVTITAGEEKEIISPTTPPLDAAGSILTAMVIAGGSAALNNLMVSLGFRQLRTPETVTPKPPLNKGWISVSVIRTSATEGPVDVGIGVPDAGGAVPAVASLDKATKPGWRYVLRDPGRFPGSGGYVGASGATVKVVCTAPLAAGGGVKTETWGPKVIADGAIIDLTFTM